MKISFILPFWTLGVASLFAQHSLQSKYNMLRIGDEIIKQQVAYKDPGRSGENVLWDFSKLESVNPEYKLKYFAPQMRRDSLYVLGKDTFRLQDIAENELIIGREHRTNYFYRIQDNVMYCMGHQHPTALLQYIAPIPVLPFPMSYGQEMNSDYRSECLYSQQVPMFTHGNIHIKADAFGKMILPTKDTLDHLIRIHTVQTFLSDTVKAMDSLRINTVIETYKWYSRGYRYPIFEAIRSAHSNDSIENVFTTAFFYPPQEHYYLEDDEDNLALLEEDEGTEIHDPQNNDPWYGLTYNFYPNPVEAFLEIEVYMPKQGQVRMQLTDRMGRLVWSKDHGNWDEGVHTVQIFMTPFTKGEYVLNMWFDEYMLGEIILKK